MGLIITKKIAKQGTNLVLIIPKNLHSYLEAGELVQISIDKIDKINEIEVNETAVSEPLRKNSEVKKNE